MRELAELLNAMRDEGILSDYALFGAIAQMRYTEPVATFDADILVILPDPDRIDLLAPIYEFCANQGYVAEGEAIRVGAWPAQFIPAFDALTNEAVGQAEATDFEGVPFRVVRAVHLAVIALSVGRAKDSARILALLESGAVTADQIREMAGRHGLEAAWSRFAGKFLDE